MTPSILYFQLRRLDGYEVTPLQLEMTAMVRMGCLHIEKDDNEGDGIFEEPGEIVFNTAFSDILQQNKVRILLLRFYKKASHIQNI